MTRTFVEALQNDKVSLATQYGALAGLGELGQEVRICFHCNYGNRCRAIDRVFFIYFSCIPCCK